MAYAQFAATVCNSTTTESEKGVNERERESSRGVEMGGRYWSRLSRLAVAVWAAC